LLKNEIFIFVCMETIPLADCTKIGYLQKPHGIRGEMILAFNEEFEESIEKATIFFVKIDGYLVPFFIEDDGFLIKSDKQARIKFRWIDSGEKARELSGSEVYLKTVDILKTEKDFNLQMLTGFLVFDSQNNKVGKISEVNDYSGNIVLTVEFSGSEILIPFNFDVVENLDSDQKSLQIRIPDGLLELNGN